MSKKSKTLAGSQLVLNEIEPLTANQLKAFDSEKHLVLHGVAGTGKTFVACYLAFDDMSKQEYRQLVIIRSAVPTRDMGFLPGSDKEKSAVYEEPYKDVAIDLFQRGDAYQILKQKGLVHFMTTSFIRGITLHNAVIIIDECQNMTFHELDSIITRVGKNCRIIFCGDFRQDDFHNKRGEQSGLSEFLNILEATGKFEMIDFKVTDIVRSDLVKDYIIAKYELGY